MKKKIVNYDGSNYDYKTYWKDREYENGAEHILLNKWFQNKSGDWIIDIGGSFARLTDIYNNRYKNCVILDYSLKTLQKNYNEIKDNYPNTFLIAANAYKTPFRENSFDAGVMIRVLHHIEKQTEYFKEVKRILREESIYIQEYANKIHIKARLRALFKKDRDINNIEPFQQPSIKPEGSPNSDVYFLNYHPHYIEKLLKNNNFEIIHKSGCSYFRINILKKILGTKILLFFEKIAQNIFRNTNISPSLFVETKLNKEGENLKRRNFEDILACPVCRGSLKFNNLKAICKDCSANYFKKENIWDFRVE